MFANRTLTIKSADRKYVRKYVNVQIECPVEGSTGEYECRYVIEWPDGPCAGTAYGFDSAQALLLAMNLVAAHLYNSSFHKDKKLSWDPASEGYGFPLSAAMKDLAVGADRFL